MGRRSKVRRAVRGCVAKVGASETLSILEGLVENMRVEVEQEKLVGKCREEGVHENLKDLANRMSVVHCEYSHSTDPWFKDTTIEIKSSNHVVTIIAHSSADEDKVSFVVDNDPDPDPFTLYNPGSNPSNIEEEMLRILLAGEIYNCTVCEFIQFLTKHLQLLYLSEAKLEIYKFRRCIPQPSSKQNSALKITD